MQCVTLNKWLMIIRTKYRSKDILINSKKVKEKLILLYVGSQIK